MKAVSLLLYKKILDKGRISEGTISTKGEKSQVIFYESGFLKSCCCFYLTKGLPSDTIVDGIQTEKMQTEKALLSRASLMLFNNIYIFEIIFI